MKCLNKPFQQVCSFGCKLGEYCSIAVNYQVVSGGDKAVIRQKVQNSHLVITAPLLVRCAPLR